MTVEFGSLVRQNWAALLTEGFDITRENANLVELESPKLAIVIAHDPRGEIDVRAFRPGTEQHHGWAYTGMVGRADVGRLLQLALVEMRRDPAILAGDAEFYAAVARDNEATSRAWADYYARRGPRPGDRHLP
jgi:hypothetical protein